jgi:hypothetical protein
VSLAKSSLEYVVPPHDHYRRNSEHVFRWQLSPKSFAAVAIDSDGVSRLHNPRLHDNVNVNVSVSNTGASLVTPRHSHSHDTGV